MMPRTGWLNILIVLLVIIAGAFVAQMLWSLLVQFSDIILLFVLAWLVSFALAPLVDRINGQSLPADVARAGARLSPALARRLERFRYTRLHAVAIVYVALAALLVFGVAALVPPTLIQFNQFLAQLPDFARQAPGWTNELQRVAGNLGYKINVETALTGLLGSLQALTSTVLQNAIVILGSVIALLANLLFVLILSFFFALDGPRLLHTVFSLVPRSLDDEAKMLTETVDRAFGGFIRAQLLQALLIGVGTGIVTLVFNQPFVLVASIFAGLFMLIPFVGSALALFPPLLTGLLHDPRQLPFSLGILLVYQLVIANVFMPKLLADALGLHPLVIIASILIGVKVGGFWGAFFGVPVAGVIATMMLFLYRRWSRLSAAQVPPLLSTAAEKPAANAPGAPQAPPARERQTIENP